MIQSVNHFVVRLGFDSLAGHLEDLADHTVGLGHIFTGNLSGQSLTNPFDFCVCNHSPLIILSTILAQVFAATSKCKSWTGTGGLFPIDEVCLAFAAGDFDCI